MIMHHLRRLVLAGLSVSFFVTGAVAPTAAEEPTSVANVQMVRENWVRHILPSEQERAFQKIPWLATFGEGMAVAAIEQKPVLLWVMNGHPLGCT